MLLFLFSLFLYCGLISSREEERAPNFNESLLSDQLHRSVLQVNAFLDNVRHKLSPEKPILRIADYDQHSTRDNEFMDYTFTNIWWNYTPWITELTEKTEETTTTTVVPVTETIPQVVINNTTQEEHIPSMATMYVDPITTTEPTPEHPNRTFEPVEYTTYDIMKPEHNSPANTRKGSSYITRPSFPFSVSMTTEDIKHKWDQNRPGVPPWDPAYKPSVDPQNIGPWSNAWTTPTPPPHTTPIYTPWVTNYGDPTLSSPVNARPAFTDFVDYDHGMGRPPKHIPPGKYAGQPSRPQFPIPEATTKAPEYSESVPTDYPYNLPVTVTEISEETQTDYPFNLPGTVTDYSEGIPTDYTFSFPVSVPPRSKTPYVVMGTTEDTYPSEFDYNTMNEPTTNKNEPPPGPKATLHPNISKYIQKWLSLGQFNTTADVHIPVGLPTTQTLLYDIQPPTSPPTQRPPVVGRTLSKAEAWVRAHHPSPNETKSLPTVVYRQTTLDGPQETFTTASGESPDFPTATAQQEHFFVEDEHGLVHLGTTPEPNDMTRTTMVDGGRPAYVPINFSPSVPTKAGDVLYQNFQVLTKSTRDPRTQYYYDEMDKLDEGYMMVFLIELTRLVALKNPKDVKDVLVNAEPIVTNLWDTARIAWFGMPLVEVAMNFAIFISETPIDLVQSYSMMTHNIFKVRKQALATDINSIIDYADLLHEDAEGEILFQAVKDFEDFPNITKTGKEMCAELIDAFMTPYRRLYHSERRQRLLDSINYALLIRFPNMHAKRRSNEESVPNSGGGSSGSSGSGSSGSSGSDSSDPSNSNSDTNQKQFRNGRISKKRTDRSKKHDNSNQGEKHRNQRYSRLYGKPERRQYAQGLRLRRTKAVTTLQRRFSVITSAHRFRGMKSSKPAIGIALPTRKTSEYRPTQMNYINGKYVRTQSFFRFNNSNGRRYNLVSAGQRDKSRRYRSTLKYSTNNQTATKYVTSFFYQMRDRMKKNSDKKIKLKADLLRKIIDKSSYSDEEEYLKMNLIDALIHGNRTFETKPISELEMKAEMLKRKLKAQASWHSYDDDISREKRQNDILY